MDYNVQINSHTRFATYRLALKSHLIKDVIFEHTDEHTDEHTLSHSIQSLVGNELLNEENEKVNICSG